MAPDQIYTFNLSDERLFDDAGVKESLASDVLEELYAEKKISVSSFKLYINSLSLLQVHFQISLIYREDWKSRFKYIILLNLQSNFQRKITNGEGFKGVRKKKKKR